MNGPKVLNLVARFVLEICALWALGYWGFHVGESDVVHWILGIGAPATAALLWGSFVSPKARYQVPAIVRLWVELDVFAAATLALFFSDKEFLAVLFAIAAIVSRTLKTVWKQ
jgi:hypothetical protein